MLVPVLLSVMLLPVPLCLPVLMMNNPVLLQGWQCSAG